jgi:hypothetical protein
MSRRIYPKEYISTVLIGEIGNIYLQHPYLAFSLICMGIEFLGKCIDETKEWGGGSSGVQFKTAIVTLFPEKYHSHINTLYKELRSGLVHRSTPGQVMLTENKNDVAGELAYINHPYNNDEGLLLVIEYFYFDFVEACKKVLSTESPNSKMNKPILVVG